MVRCPLLSFVLERLCLNAVGSLGRQSLPYLRASAHVSVLQEVQDHASPIPVLWTNPQSKTVWEEFSVSGPN